MSLDHMPAASPSLTRLVEELNKLPGIGPKSAQRLAYYIIRLPQEEAIALADAITNVKQAVGFCQQCQNLADVALCPVCADPRRDREECPHPVRGRDLAECTTPRAVSGTVLDGADTFVT